MKDENLTEGAQQLNAMMTPLEGLRVRGGCDECESYQTVERLDSGDGPAVSWRILVHHDDECPVYAEHRRLRRSPRLPGL